VVGSVAEGEGTVVFGVVALAELSHSHTAVPARPTMRTIRIGTHNERGVLGGRGEGDRISGRLISAAAAAPPTSGYAALDARWVEVSAEAGVLCVDVIAAMAAGEGDDFWVDVSGSGMA